MNSSSLVPSGGTPRFAFGAAVRVRASTTDPDFGDVALGGWCGKITDIDPTADPPLYLVAWSPATFAGMPSAYRVRCDRKGLDFEECWLSETDLEPDDGRPPTMEQPKALSPLPLDPELNDDRVRAIFRLTTDEPLPPVEDDSLEWMHDYFREKLKLPASAQSHLGGANRLVIIRRLVPMADIDLESGLMVAVEYGDKVEEIPLAEVSLMVTNAIAKDIEAYGEWFYEHQDETSSSDSSFEDAASGPFRVEMFLARVLLACLLVGGLLGALLWTIESAGIAAQVGGGFLGVIGAITMAKWERRFRAVNELPSGFLMGAALGFLGGAILGGTAGVLVVAYVGAIPGLIAGTLLGQLLAAVGVRNHRTIRLALLGAYLGAMVYAFMLDSTEAIRGCSRGAAGGIGLFVVGYLLTKFMMSRLPQRR